MAQIELDQAAKPFPVTLTLARIEIAGARLHLPAAALGLGMPKLAPLRLTGDVLVDIAQLSLEPGRIQGDATLQWRSASSALTPVSSLGAAAARRQRRLDQRCSAEFPRHGLIAVERGAGRFELSSSKMPLGP